MGIRIRRAEARDYAITESIEARADTLLIDYLQATDWPAVTPASQRERAAGFTLVALDEASGSAIGFGQAIEVDGLVHLEQIAVLPEFGRLGYGRQLVVAVAEEARGRGHDRITLERAAGLFEYGRRIQMTLPL